MSTYEPTDPDNDLEADVRKDNALEDDPNPERDTADWLESIGPEGMSPDEVMEELEASGFDEMEEDSFDSSPAFASDMTNWSDNDDFKEESDSEVEPSLEAKLEREIANQSNERPVEDQAIRELESGQDGFDEE